jgi:hypothetical protein
MTHDKDFSPCVVGEGARQCVFIVQKSVVQPLPCALIENTQQVFDVRFLDFAVRTVKLGSPVVFKIRFKYLPNDINFVS